MKLVLVCVGWKININVSPEISIAIIFQLLEGYFLELYSVIYRFA